MTSTPKYQIVILVSILTLAFSGKEATRSGSWSKNGATMSGSHTTTWIQPKDRGMQSVSNAQTPRGVIQYIFVDSSLQDRCQNPNGTWQSWQQFGYAVNDANWAYSSGTATARGTYQDCAVNHQYRSISRHIFVDSGFGLNETKTLTSGL